MPENAPAPREAPRDRGDNCYHWMRTMHDLGEAAHDPTRSGLDETAYRPGGAA